MTVHLHKGIEKIPIKRGVRQGDTISPELYTATLESIFRRLNWEKKGVNIDGEFLTNLSFADDISLCTETPQELQQMLQELSDESRRMCLKMNIPNTKVMVMDITPITVNNMHRHRHHPNKREQFADRKCRMLLRPRTTLQPQGKEPGQRYTTKNHGQTPVYIQKQPCHLLEETYIQLMCAASCDIMVQRPGH